MKRKLEIVNTITTNILFVLLAAIKTPFLFWGAFILLLARGIMMYLKAISEDFAFNENQPKQNFKKLLLLRILFQLFPILFVLTVLFVFFLRKEVWLSSLH